LILDFEFDQHLESHKHVISIIMGFRDTGCYNVPPVRPSLAATADVEAVPVALAQPEDDVSSGAGRASRPWVVQL
jgi:hypothetical protein